MFSLSQSIHSIRVHSLKFESVLTPSQSLQSIRAFHLIREYIEAESLKRLYPSLFRPPTRIELLLMDLLTPSESVSLHPSLFTHPTLCGPSQPIRSFLSSPSRSYSPSESIHSIRLRVTTYTPVLFHSIRVCSKICVSIPESDISACHQFSCKHIIY